MSVLFSDLRGFTSITEKGNPEDLVEQLNEYFTRMVEIVFRNGGTVDKFVGDMVMALFGAPVDDVDHADDAVTTAVEMVRELGELNRRWAAEGRVQLDIGIGVNSGDMIADPDMEVALYPSRQMAEALSYQDCFGYRQVYPEPGKINPRAKKELNSFLNQWLSNIIAQGHR